MKSRVLSTCFVALLGLAGCQGNQAMPASTGGNANTGGQTSVSTGGTVISPSTGGAAAMGGNTVPTATGGVLSTGGAAATGGNTRTGGTSNTGGAASQGGVAATGGATSPGGSVVDSGVTPPGGSTRTGGATGTGGSVGTGGVAGTGGTPGTAGTLGTGTPAPSVGCGKTSTVTFGAVPGESGTAVGFGTGGYVKIGSRGFAMRLPDNYDNNKPYWLIFGFHWNGGNSKEVDSGGSNGYEMAHFGLQKLSKNGAIFVAPDGLNAGWGGDNLPFVDDMVKLITENYCVDTTRLYTNGFSYGGGMSYAIACARAKVFRGAAIYEGAVLSGCVGGNDPIAYWQMAGTTDNTCTISMATPMRDKFAKNNGCTLPATEPPRPASSTSAHICTDYTGCSSGHPLRWCVHPSGHGNAIVDGSTDLYNTCATPPKTCSDTCKCSWVPADVWKFFTSL